MKCSLLFLSICFATPAYCLPSSMTDGRDDQSVTVDIATDLPPPASAEKVVPTHPFFSETAANELMEKVQDLEERVQKLEKAAAASKK